MSQSRILRDRLEGFAAEYYVANLLARNGCVVRTVPEDSIRGMSLHCETDETSRGRKEPFQHFWIHVRTGDRVGVVERGRQASCLFLAQELEYWARQPIPVFALLIPDYSRDNPPDAIYVVSLSEHLAGLRLPLEKDKVTLRSTSVIRDGSAEDVRRFVGGIAPRKQVPVYTPGQTEPLPPHLRQLYVLEPSVESGDRHWWEACEELRKTAAMALPCVIDAFPQCPEGESGEFLQVLRSRVMPLVRLFAEAGDQHWETHYALGVEANSRGDYERALGFFEMAESYVTVDGKFKREYPHWPQVVEDIRLRKESCLAVLDEDL